MNYMCQHTKSLGTVVTSACHCITDTLTTSCCFKRSEFIWDPAFIRKRASESRRL